MTLNKNSILNAADRPLKSVEVPEWGGAVYVRTMSGAERGDWENLVYKDGKVSVGSDVFRTSLLVRTLTDDAGARIFSDTDAADLAGKSSVILNRLFDEASAVNGLGPKEDAAKNS